MFMPERRWLELARVEVHRERSAILHTSLLSKVDAK